MEGKMKELLLGLILIVFGVALIPIVFTAVSGTNWNLTAGGTLHDMSWIGYLIGLVFGVAILAVGIAVVVNAFKGK